MKIIYLIAGFLKKNWFGIFGILVGIMGTLYSIWETKKEREPAFYVTKNVGLFSSPQGLSSEYFAFIKRSDGSEILNNVYLLEASFWNKGKEPIKAEDVLEPINIRYDENVEIIEAFIAQVSRKNIIKPELQNDNENKKLLLNFRVMEKDDAIGIQVLYSAKSPVDFDIDGVISETKSILTREKLVAENLVGSGIKIFTAFLCLVGAMIAFSFLTNFLKYFIGKIHEKSEKVANIIIAVVAVSAMLFCITVIGKIAIKGTLRDAEANIIESIPKTEQINPLKN